MLICRKNRGALFVGLLLMASASFSAHALKVIGSRVSDLNGQLIQLGMDGTNLKPVVITFLDSQCNQSKAYSRELNQLSRTARQQGFVFYGVISEPSLTWQAAKNFSAQQGFEFNVILDSDGNLANELKPQVAPEAFIIGKYDQLFYRGLIDDRFDDQGKARPVRSRNLADAMSAASRHKVSPNTQAMGCPQAVVSQPVMPAKVTYNQHVAPLLNANCAECHRPKGIAPFHLLNYTQARNFSGMIAYVTQERIMPPWKAEPDSAHYLNERLLSEHQIDLLGKWVKSGAAEGPITAATPPPKLNTSEWQMGEPDIIISMPETFDIPADGPDIYRYFVARDAIPNDLEIAAIDFKPGDASVVHHCNFFIDYGNKASAKEDENTDGKPGFSVFGTGGFFSYWKTDNSAAGMGAWAPGGNPVRYPDGMGMKVPGGADFVFEIHYHPTGKKTRDRSRLAIYLAKKKIKIPVSAVFMGTNQVDIPAGDSDYQRHFYMDIPADMSIVDIGPHMHYLGTKALAVATLPDGSKKTLLDVNWDFRWQGAYYYREPVKLPKGSRIDAWTRYDNSSDNPYNPFNPPVRATWGWGTDQEMGELYLTIIADDSGDMLALQEAARQSWLRPSDPETSQLTIAQAIGRLRHTSTWAKAGESLLLQLLSSEENLAEATALLEQQISDQPKDAKPHMILGSLMALGSMLSDSTLTQYSMIMDAQSHYEAALQLDPTLWDPRFGLAKGFADSGSWYYDDAIEHFTILIKQQQQSDEQHTHFALPYKELGDLYLRQDELDKALDIWRLGSQRFPKDADLQQRLAQKKSS